MGRGPIRAEPHCICYRNTTYPVCSSGSGLPTALPYIVSPSLRNRRSKCIERSNATSMDARSYIVHSSFAVMLPLHFAMLAITSEAPLRTIWAGLVYALRQHLGTKPTPISASPPFPKWRFVRFLLPLTAGATIPGLLWFIAISLAPYVSTQRKTGQTELISVAELQMSLHYGTRMHSSLTSSQSGYSN